MLNELKKQIEQRFTYDAVPDANGYVPIDLIASALDPRTKALHWLPDDQREAVWTEIDKYSPHPCTSLLHELVLPPTFCLPSSLHFLNDNLGKSRI